MQWIVSELTGELRGRGGGDLATGTICPSHNLLLYDLLQQVSAMLRAPSENVFAKLCALSEKKHSC